MDQSISDKQDVVLIVDDDASLRKSLRRLVKSVGYEAKTFASGQEFLESGITEGCLVLDVRMAGMTGFDVCRAVNEQGMQLRVVMMSAQDSPHARRRAREAGAVRWLHKPFEAQELLEAVEVAKKRDQFRSMPPSTDRVA